MPEAHSKQTPLQGMFRSLKLNAISFMLTGEPAAINRRDGCISQLQMCKCLRRSRSLGRTAFPLSLLNCDYELVPVKIETVPVKSCLVHVNAFAVHVDALPSHVNGNLVHVNGRVRRNEQQTLFVLCQLRSEQINLQTKPFSSINPNNSKQKFNIP